MTLRVAARAARPPRGAAPGRRLPGPAARARARRGPSWPPRDSSPPRLRARTGGGTSRRCCCSPPSRSCSSRWPGRGDGGRAAAGGHRHPGLRRVDEHGRQGPRAHPARRRQGGCPRLRREAAVDDPAGGRGVRRLGGHLAAADQRPRRGAGRHRPARPAGRHGARARDRVVASAPSPASRSASTRPGRTAPQGATDLGYYGSAAVVLLSDGENTTDPDPLVLAELASTAGVRIYPIGLGQPAGHGPRGRRLPGRDALSTRPPSSRSPRRRTAPTTPRATRPPSARSTRDIDLTWTARTEQREITSWFAAAAALLLLLGAGVSVVRSGRVV